MTDVRSQSAGLMPVIIAVSMVSAIGGLVFNTMPLILGAISKEFGLEADALGNLSSIAGWGYLAGTLSAPFWVDRVNWKLAAFVFSAFAALTFFVLSKAPASSLTAGFLLPRAGLAVP